MYQEKSRIIFHDTKTKTRQAEERPKRIHLNGESKPVLYYILSSKKHI